MRYTIKKLRQLGKEQGIKCSSRMTSETLCEKLNIPYERCVPFDTHNRDKILNPVAIVGGDPVTGEKVCEFPSIYKTAKFFSMNPRYVYVYIKEKKVVVVNGEKVVLIKKV